MPIWLALLIAVGAFWLGVFSAWVVFGSYGGGQTSGESRVDFVVLLSLLVIVTAFVGYELAGLVLPGWHTVSFFAIHNPALAIGIAVAAFLALIAFEVWWWRHMHSSIPK